MSTAMHREHIVLSQLGVVQIGCRSPLMTTIKKKVTFLKNGLQKIVSPFWILRLPIRVVEFSQPWVRRSMITCRITKVCRLRSARVTNLYSSGRCPAGQPVCQALTKAVAAREGCIEFIDLFALTTV